MKSTGIIRRIDDLGRVVIAKEIRRTLNISEGDPLETFVDGENIILKKYNPGCIFCGQVNGITDFEGKNICPECISKMSKLDVKTIARKSAVGGGK